MPPNHSLQRTQRERCCGSFVTDQVADLGFQRSLRHNVYQVCPILQRSTLGNIRGGGHMFHLYM
jgi:hypothetical protein